LTQSKLGFSFKNLPHREEISRKFDFKEIPRLDDHRDQSNLCVKPRQSAICGFCKLHQIITQ